MLSIFKNYKLVSKILLVSILFLFLSSCNIVKRVKADEHLIVDNTVIEDGKVNNEERVNNIHYPKD